MVSTGFLSSLTALLLANTVSAGPPSRDWKLIRGWDGVVSSPTTVGTPLNGTAEALKARATGNLSGVYICSGANWQQPCAYAVQPLNTCIVLGDDWNDLIVSMGGDPGTIIVAYGESHCSGAHIDLGYPGTGNLGAGWEGVISSFKVSEQV